MIHYISLGQFAAQIGVKPSTLSGYKVPQPDVMVGSTRGWKQSTVDEWIATRPGKGAGAGRKKKSAQ